MNQRWYKHLISKRWIGVLALAIIAVTHDEKIYDRLDHIFHLRDGRLTNEHEPKIAGVA